MSSAVDNWYISGWQRVLPFTQSFALYVLVSTATIEKIDGSLDHLLKITSANGFDVFSDSLDSPVIWTDPKFVDDLERIQLDHQRRDLFCSALSQAGLPIPETVRQLASTMVQLGIFHHHTDSSGEQWRSAPILPLPTEVLPFPLHFVQQEDQMRWQRLHESATQAIIHHLMYDLEKPAHIMTSVQRLAETTALNCHDIRQGLDNLTTEGGFRVLRNNIVVDPLILADHAKFQLAIDWDYFYSSRVAIHKSKIR